MVKYFLVSTGGDCSSTGMGDTDDVKPVLKKHVKAVKKYIRDDYEFQETFSYYSDQSQLPGRVGEIAQDKIKVAFLNTNASTDVMVQLGYFNSKFEKRTKWSLLALDDDERSKFN